MGTECAQVEAVEFASDHSFADHRIALSVAVVEGWKTWIERVAGEAG